MLVLPNTHTSLMSAYQVPETTPSSRQIRSSKQKRLSYDLGRRKAAFFDMI
jgi:hypothetical protein